MKSIPFLLLFLVLSMQANAQQILNKDYYFVNGREITQLRQAGDTLYQYKCRPDFRCSKHFSIHYLILQIKSSSRDYLLKVEKLDTLQLSSTPIPPERFSLIGIKKIDEVKIKYIIATLSLTQDSISTIPFKMHQIKNEFGFTAYSKSYLNSLNNDYSLSKSEAEEILNAMKKNEKVLNLYKESVASKVDLYNSGITSELLNIEMTRRGFNPIFAKQVIEIALRK